MTERDRDEQLLIDFVLGRCDAQAAQEVRGRLAWDEAFSALHVDISNALAAVGACPAPDPPEDLVDRTTARVRAMRRTESLVEAQPAAGAARRPMFSFREVAALAAVFVLAAGIMIPSIRAARRDAQRTLCADNVGAIHTAMSHYANGNAEILPGAAVETRCWLFRPGAKFASNSAGLFLLVRQHYASPDVFQCPAAGGGGFVVEGRMIDFPSPGDLGYSYQHNLDGRMRRDDPELVPVAEYMAILTDTTPLFVNGKFRRDRVERRVSENHANTGQNVLYLNGSVRWATHPCVGVDGDNIWLAGSRQEYVGNETPISRTDTFVLPHPGR